MLTSNGGFCILFLALRREAQANDRWKISSAGRASALQAEGHRFEPCIFHHHGAVVQLVRMPACHAGGRGFEPLLRRHDNRSDEDRLSFAQIAQSVEQGTENPRVVGSIPTLGTRKTAFPARQSFFISPRYDKSEVWTK